MVTFKEMVDARLFGKVVAGITIIGTGALIYIEPTLFDNQSIKEIFLFILGGSTGLLFADKS
jgi:hypothetical protein